MDRIEAWLAQGRMQRSVAGRPRVSLCYAQSLDGSLTHRRGETLALSGPESRVLTHRLRAAHDAILIGIGTLLADDPLLTVRDALGSSPIPIVLDSRLRLPLDCGLLLREDQKPWVATTWRGDPRKGQALEAAGARLLNCSQDDRGGVALPALLSRLAEAGVGSLMVEGGARVITSFLRQGLVDQAVVTIAPCFIGGLPIVEAQVLPGPIFPRMVRIETMQLGEDIIAWGELDFGR